MNDKTSTTIDAGSVATFGELASLNRIDRTFDAVEQADTPEAIGEAIDGLAAVEDRLQTPWFGPLLMAVVHFTFFLAGMAASVFAALFWHEVITNWERLDYDGGLTVVLALVTLTVLLSTIGFGARMRTAWHRFRTNAGWFGRLHALTLHEVENHLMGRTFPRYDGDALWQSLRRRFSDFDHGDEDQYIDGLEAIDWPSADEAQDVGAQRAWVYSFHYTEVTETDETDSDGHTHTETHHTQHWRYGVILPFRHDGWLRLSGRAFGRGNWRPTLPALDGAMRVQTDAPQNAARLLKPQVELAIAELYPYFNSLDIELSEGYLRIGFDDEDITALSKSANDLTGLARLARTATVPAPVQQLQQFTALLRRANRHAGRSVKA